MAVTRISDIIEPSVFAAYIREAVIEKSAIIRSGIVTQNAQLNALVAGGGRTITMPFWKRIGGESEIITDSGSLTPDKISTSADIATMHIRGRAWGARELASALAGSSAMDAIGSMIAEWWTRDEQRVLIKTLSGAFAAANMTEHVHDVGGPITAEATLDAKQKLGDASDQLTAIIMHSATYTALQKLNLIEFIPDSRGEIAFVRYLGYNVIVDDTMPVDSGTYTTYLMASGVIGRGDGTPVDLTPVETDRDSLAGEDYLVSRRAFILHPMGVKWIGTAASTTPSNSELETGANWERVYEDKHIGMVKMTHTLA